MQYNLKSKFFFQKNNLFTNNLFIAFIFMLGLISFYGFIKKNFTKSANSVKHKM